MPHLKIAQLSYASASRRRMQEWISKKCGFSLLFSPALELLITRRSLVQIQLPQPHEWLSVQKDIELFSLHTHKKLQKVSLRNNEVSNSFGSSANSSADIFLCGSSASRRREVGKKYKISVWLDCRVRKHKLSRRIVRIILNFNTVIMNFFEKQDNDIQIQSFVGRKIRLLWKIKQKGIHFFVGEPVGKNLYDILRFCWAFE